MIDYHTYVITESDQGTASMKGAFCINEWLIKEGYLVLNNPPIDILNITKCDVNWKKTKRGAGAGIMQEFFSI